MQSKVNFDWLPRTHAISQNNKAACFNRARGRRKTYVNVAAPTRNRTLDVSGAISGSIMKAQCYNGHELDISAGLTEHSLQR
jgi:hypothetical protein